MEILDYLQKEAKIVDREILRLIPEEMEPKKLTQASRHLIKAGGKRLRPALTLTASEAVGGKSENAIKTAAALEILHTFTLVHDDIMDQDDFRRGTETVHKLWGEPMAIISGDALFAKVFEALSKNAESEGLSVKKTIQLFDTVSKTSLKICQGQALDIEFEKRKKVTEPEYLEMVEKKTGALMRACTKTGALLGGGSKKEIDAMAKYGRLMGIAFQIHDDFLGATGEQEKVGKPIGSDIQEGKWTFLAVHAYQKASKGDRKTLLNILNKEEVMEEEVKEVVDIYRKTKAIDFAKNKARELVEEAKSQLDMISDSAAKKFLLEIADFSIEREL